MRRLREFMVVLMIVLFLSSVSHAARVTELIIGEFDGDVSGNFDFAEEFNSITSVKFTFDPCDGTPWEPRSCEDTLGTSELLTLVLGSQAFEIGYGRPEPLGRPIRKTLFLDLKTLKDLLDGSIAYVIQFTTPQYPQLIAQVAFGEATLSVKSTITTVPLPASLLLLLLALGGIAVAGRWRRS